MKTNLSPARLFLKTLLLPAWLSICPSVSGFILIASAASANSPIDRHALVVGHNVMLDRYDTNNSIQLGNGESGFAVDATGLQTFTENLGTFSDWGWQTFPNPQGFREAETWAEIVRGGGRKVPYATPGCSCLYLPTHGRLLWAVALMAADGNAGPTNHTPGFPGDGSWVVKWEELKKAP